MNFAKLEKIELRNGWETEDKHFTPWLAKEENLEELGKAIHMDLILEEVEQSVGPFRADIICRDGASDNLVLIENQLEKTNHKHLGQIFTYAAGTKAMTIVWIASEFTEEHRATLDWLNNITDDKFNFFGIEVELFKIGNSNFAPHFKLVSKPNDWSKSMNTYKNISNSGELTNSKRLYLSYWNKLADTIREGSSVLKTQKPRPQHWYNFAIGKTGFKLATTLKTQKNMASTELYINKDKEAFKTLELDKEHIEQELGFALSWEYLPERDASRVAIYKENFDANDESSLNQTIQWHIEMLEKLHSVFSKRIKNLENANLRKAA